MLKIFFFILGCNGGLEVSSYSILGNSSSNAAEFYTFM